VTLGSAKSEHPKLTWIGLISVLRLCQHSIGYMREPRLTNHEIVCEDFQPVITIPQRHGWTDDLP